MNTLHPIKIKGETKAALALAVQLAFELDANWNDFNGARPLTQAVSYKTSDDIVVFYSDVAPGATSLLSPLDHTEVTSLILKWLKNTAKYPKPPFFDGDTHHGWQLTNAEYQDRAEHWSRVLQVQACNILYGK